MCHNCYDKMVNPKPMDKLLIVSLKETVPSAHDVKHWRWNQHDANALKFTSTAIQFKMWTLISEITVIFQTEE